MAANVRNSGILTTGGSTTVSGSAVGDNATVNVTEPTPVPTGRRKADIGVIAVKPVELRAVREVLGLRPSSGGELPFHEGEVQVRDRTARVAAIRTLSQGQRSAVTAFGDLRQHYQPAVIALVGIGGGIHRDVNIGDVVIGTQVVYYDRRKETPSQVWRRGEDVPAPAPIVRAINTFFDDHDEPARFQAQGSDGVLRGYQVLHGPIGSGEAVIADVASEIRRYLVAYNDTTRAVDMEAGGLVRAFYEQSGVGRVEGWLVIRGISDNADPDKGDDPQAAAAWHAAKVLRALLPYLPLGRSTRAER
ncbi:5'-methylthioadenosine/S-adenosylhomocysteine nucleosidase family protein [Sphaerisporangium rhizosphaerae]|uniref:Nucleoside phosphorylase domain-containing protein n=1 Tax=Sphaerisporangium rhizosphaerae TaxID=2269375 RepID=A0ABW2NXN4_9ACTN